MSDLHDIVTIDRCPVCGCDQLNPFLTRSDGVAVLQCANCRMAFVERYLRGVEAFYDDQYYYPEITTGAVQGYSNYDATAAHSLSWVTEWVRLVRESGTMLDIGCANGFLLKSLADRFDGYGIEVNPQLARRCEEDGITIIANDIGDERMLATYRTTFDVITAIAVIEHVPDILTTMRHIKQLLGPQGIFIFEVPLVSAANDNTTWLTSSLEHIYYPTIEVSV
ncbi:MAG TPA: class I SAM-dependent methyltransferase [Roseiflexaceae bacterium]|mgnify:FL=1|nr:class I SAM-dependent methyltransferase [Roseiflexaceae bacterium]